MGGQIAVISVKLRIAPRPRVTIRASTRRAAAGAVAAPPPVRQPVRRRPK
jgi:hypothetical protein